MGTTTPKVIVFDVNETLSDMSPLDHAFATAGAPPASAAAWFAAVLRDGFALTATGRQARFLDLASDNLRDVFHTVLADVDTTTTRAGILDVFGRLDVHSDVAPGVIALRREGFRFVTLTNGSVATTEALLGRAGLRDSFELLMSVDDAGAWKPARQAYQHAIGRCGVDASEMLMVAVHPWDIDGAAQAGLRTAWVNRDSREYPRSFAAPDVVVSGVDELAAALGHPA